MIHLPFFCHGFCRGFAPCGGMQRKEQDIMVVAIRPFCACHSFVQSFGLASYSLDYGSVLGLWCQGVGRGTQRDQFFACICEECGSCSCRSLFMCARAGAFTDIVYIHTPFFPLALFFLLWTAVVGSRIHFQLPNYEFHHNFELVQFTWKKDFFHRDFFTTKSLHNKPINVDSFCC